MAKKLKFLGKDSPHMTGIYSKNPFSRGIWCILVKWSVLTVFFYFSYLEKNVNVRAGKH